MTRARWNWVRIRSIIIVGLALWHIFQGTDVGAAKGFALLALAMAWCALDESTAQRGHARLDESERKGAA